MGKLVHSSRAESAAPTASIKSREGGDDEGLRKGEQ